jgi:hypothetical protein
MRHALRKCGARAGVVPASFCVGNIRSDEYAIKSFLEEHR